ASALSIDQGAGSPSALRERSDASAIAGRRFETTDSYCRFRSRQEGHSSKCCSRRIHSSSFNSPDVERAQSWMNTSWLPDDGISAPPMEPLWMNRVTWFARFRAL